MKVPVARTEFGKFMWIAVKVLNVLLLLTFILGMILFFAPGLIDKWNRLLYSPRSMRRPLRPFEVPVDISYRLKSYRTLIGILLMAGALHMVYYFGFVIGPAEMLKFRSLWVSTKGGAFFMDIILETIRILFIIFGSAGFFAVLLFTFKPEVYERLSLHSDRWLSSRMLIMPLEQERYVEGAIFLRYHRLFGTLAVVGSLYALWRFSFLPPAFFF